MPLTKFIIRNAVDRQMAKWIPASQVVSVESDDRGTVVTLDLPEFEPAPYDLTSLGQGRYRVTIPRPDLRLFPAAAQLGQGRYVEFDSPTTAIYQRLIIPEPELFGDGEAKVYPKGPLPARENRQGAVQGPIIEADNASGASLAYQAQVGRLPLAATRISEGIYQIWIPKEPQK